MTQSTNPYHSYQLVINSIPPTNPLPSYSADPKKAKQHKPKNLSKNLYLNVQILSSFLMYQVNPATFCASALIGAAKPLADHFLYKMKPQKDLDTDSNPKDFGKLSAKDKLACASLAFLVPVYVASYTQAEHPLFSIGVTALVTSYSFYDLSQRLVRWINPPK